jgi:hypothetical protein
MLTVMDRSGDVPSSHLLLPPSDPRGNALDFEILSDVAVLGASYAIQAENLVRVLASRSHHAVRQTGKYLPEEDTERFITRISDVLFESDLHWPGNPFINQVGHSLCSRMDRAYADSGYDGASFGNELVGYIGENIQTKTKHHLANCIH